MPNTHVPAAATGLPKSARRKNASSAATPVYRERMEMVLEKLLAASDRLIETLDALDASDVDLEDFGEDFDGHGFGSHSTDDEDSLGSLCGSVSSDNQEGWAGGLPSDLEDEHDGCEHGSALEWATTVQVTRRDPEGRALAYHLVEGDQTSWATGAGEDLEDADEDEEHDGREETEEGPWENPLLPD